MSKIKKAGVDGDPGSPTDIVIPIMGPSGVGKSTFINMLCSPHTAVRVGHGLNPCTTELQPIVISPSSGDGEGRRWVIVDTPGFEETFIDEPKVLELISEWLEKSYGRDKKLTGFVYLHDISQPRIQGVVRKNFGAFHNLCGEDALSVIVPCMTKWDNVEVQVVEAHQNWIFGDFWRPIQESAPHKFLNNYKSAWEILTYLLERRINATARRIKNANRDIELLPGDQLEVPLLHATDLVIPIMGPPGVGKSTFINTLYGGTVDVVQVGLGLESCTRVPRPIIIKPPDGPFKGRRLIIVDTPSLNTLSGGEGDLECLRLISALLVSYYECHVRLAGVVYLSQASNNKDRQIFQKMICGEGALSVVIVGTRREGLADGAIDECKPISKELFWDGPSCDRSAVHQFQGTYECAWEIVNHLAHNNGNSIVLRIQQEPFDIGHPGTPPKQKTDHMANLYRLILTLLGLNVSGFQLL